MENLNVQNSELMVKRSCCKMYSAAGFATCPHCSVLSLGLYIFKFRKLQNPFFGMVQEIFHYKYTIFVMHVS